MKTTVDCVFDSLVHRKRFSSISDPHSTAIGEKLAGKTILDGVVMSLMMRVSFCKFDLTFMVMGCNVLMLRTGTKID